MAEIDYAPSIKLTKLQKDSIMRQEFYYKKNDAKEAEIQKQMKEVKEYWTENIRKYLWKWTEATSKH